MTKEKKLILFLFLAFILTVFLLKIDAYAVNKLTNEELITAKNNGIVSAMCYVQNLMTGAVAKSIMALSVLGVGWLFLLGGASWVTVLTFTVATSLVFGGLELANIISGNNLSCQSILKAEEEFYETVYNKGLCGINKISIYKTGQTWLACVKDGNTKNIDNCPKKIDNDTYIEEKYDAANQIFKTVVLSKCQEGYLKKDNNIYLEYQCNKDKNGFGFFKDHKENNENLENGACKLACKESSLNYIYKGYNLAPIMDTNEKIKILKGRLENGYYPQDTELQIQCASGFIAYFDEGKDSKETCFGEECKNKDKFSLKCTSDGIFKPNINCKRACSYDPYKDVDDNVNEWGRYNRDKDNEYEPFDENDKLFIEGDKVIIKDCKPGYMLAKGQKGLIGECRESQWWWDLGGSKCQITCKKSDLNLNGDKWFGCDDSSNCNKDISKMEQFASGDSIVASGKCESGYSISGLEEDFLKYTCAQNGRWENNGGKSCKLNCKISDINNELPGREHTTKWNFLGSNSNGENIENGEKIQPIACKTGYNVYPNNSTIYVCKDGKFLYYGGPSEEYCKKGCKFEELKYLSYANIPNGYDLTNSTKTWVECNDYGLAIIKTAEEKDKEGNIDRKEVYGSIIDLEKIEEANLFARSESYYRIEECRDGYERVTKKEDDILVAKCSESKDTEKKVEWSITKFNWNACRVAPKCYEFHVDANDFSKEITIGSNKASSIDYPYYGNSSINVKMQLWGAPGGSNDDTKKSLGGYSKGILLLKPEEGNRTLYITVGGSGISSKTKSGAMNTGRGGFNGGGDGGRAIIEKDGMCQISNGSGGGGATDIRYGGKLLDNRIIVAGGGGGESGWSQENGLVITGYKGGGKVGDGDKSLSRNGKGGTQKFSDLATLLDPIYNSFVTSGVKGFGGHGTIYTKDKSCIGGAGGGGGGYYGGSAGAPGAGGGGSGYIGGGVTDGQTTVVSIGPQDGGFARICWGDWHRQNDPCDSNHEEKTSYENDAGFDNNRTKCIKVNARNGTNDNDDKSVDVVVQNDIGECSSESLKTFMNERNISIPEVLNDKLPKKYYEGMTIRQECGEGYIAKDHKTNIRVTFRCDGNNVWNLSESRCIKRGCQEFKFVGADEPFEIPETVEEVKMQVWGGQGNIGEYNKVSGKGGYSYGNMLVNDNNKNLFVHVGAEGISGLFWNNGAGNSGIGNNKGKFIGGGASDIRITEENLSDNTNSLNSRIIVAGGAGAAGYYPGGAGGGGNSDGFAGSSSGDSRRSCAGNGGTQIAGGDKTSIGISSWGPRFNGIFGFGGDSFGYLAGATNGSIVGSGGGSGWYGGGGGCNDSQLGGGGGGSGHLSDNIIPGTGGGESGNRKGDGFARICWGDHPACDDTIGTRNEECKMEEYSCNNAEVPSEYNVAIPASGNTVAGTSKVFECKSGYTGTVKFWCGRDKWVYFSGECKIAHGCYEFTAPLETKDKKAGEIIGKGKKLDMSNVNFGGDSTIKIQLWGARGGGNNPGLGGYSKGTLKLSTDKVLYVFVGGTPLNMVGGFNGGGGAGTSSGFGGGGATDIRYGGLTLDKRIMVAGGGGGFSRWSGGRAGFSGGGLNGVSGGQGGWDGKGGGQAFNCIIPSDNNFNTHATCGVKGVGGYGSNRGAGGGGGGYYGGSGGGPHGGGGGSGYIGDGVTDGQTTVVSTSPANGGFARICWGDWGDQTNPCDSDYARSTSYDKNAGLNNKTKCTFIDKEDKSLEDVVGGTAPSCSLANFNTKMDLENVNKPGGLQNVYYEGMYIKIGCKSGYSLVSGGAGVFRATCGSDGNWSVNGTCAVSPVCYEFTAPLETKDETTGEIIKGKGKKLDMSNVNFGGDSTIKIQLWGARGGGNNPGLGGYSKGTLKLLADKVLYIFVGGNPSGIEGGFNGGGYGGVGTSISGYGGGGATDIRYGGLTLDKRIMVAGGGGGGSNKGSSGGKGGGDNGGGAEWHVGGGSQTSGGVIDTVDGGFEKTNVFSTIGVLGQGGHGSGFSVPGSGSGAGGGYYGGGGGEGSGTKYIYSAGGGSGYINKAVLENGETKDAQKGSENGGFARICWGDWTGQTNPCDSDYNNEASYTSNAGLNNKTKCIVNPSKEDVVGGTLPKCSSNTLITTMASANVNELSNTVSSKLPPDYYQGMAVRNYCKSGYSLATGGVNGRVEFTCGSDGNWSVNGSCIQDCTITQNPGGYGWWTTDGSDKLVVNNKVPYGTTIKQVCPPGYSYGSNRRTATCNGEGKKWTDVNLNNSCFVPGGCKGKPNLVAGAKFYPDAGNIQSIGNFYVNGEKVTLNHTNINSESFTAENKSKIDAWCNENWYKEVSDGGTCTNGDDCAMPANWSGLIYCCNNGEWKQQGDCKRNCNSSPSTITGGSWSSSSATHGGTVTLRCNSGYTLSGSKTATCNDGSWEYSGNAVCVYGACRGKPNLVAGSGVWFSRGSVYLNGTAINTVSNDSNALAVNGTIFDANCASDYTEVSTDGDCTASQCGGQNNWGHYYYCQNGTWKRVGNCVKDCYNIDVYRKFAVNNEDSCKCDQGTFCEVNTKISFLEHGSTTSRSCDTGDTTKKCSFFCTTYHRRASGYCDVSCDNGVAKINCVQTRACSQGNDKSCD